MFVLVTPIPSMSADSHDSSGLQLALLLKEAERESEETETEIIFS